jgi:hypothetical protein
MSIIDSIYNEVEQSYNIQDLLGVTEWDTTGIYAGYKPADSTYDYGKTKVPYITYSYDKNYIDPWPMEAYVLDFDIWDINDGNDTTTVEEIGSKLKDLLDRATIRDENNHPTTLFLQADFYFPEMPGVIHRKITFAFRFIDFSVLTA